MIAGTTGLLLVWGLHVLLPLGIAAYARRRWRRAEQQAKAPPIAPGLASLHGVVDFAPGEQVALRVAIKQTGREFKAKNGVWNQLWTEVSRSVTARPFYVNDERGGRIRIEPVEKTLLVDKIDRKVRHDKTNRDVFAELGVGEKVFVVGELVPARTAGQGGYREAQEPGLVMRSPRGGRLLVSTEPLGARFERDAERYAMTAKFFAGFAVVFALVDATFHARVAFGDVQNGKVVGTARYSGKNPHCELELELASGTLVKASASTAWCSHSTEGQTVPAYGVGDGHVVHLGREPAIANGAIIVSVVVLVMALFVHLLRTKAWYEGKATASEPGRL